LVIGLFCFKNVKTDATVSTNINELKNNKTQVYLKNKLKTSEQ